jgi:uncharacterized protein YdaU (DUF1376 family)
MRDTSHLSLAEHGAYTVLLDHYYATGKPLPNDDMAIARICRSICQDDAKAVASVLAQFFPVNGDGFRHNTRADTEILKEKSISEKRADAGRRGAQGKWHGKRHGNEKAIATTSTSTSTEEHPQPPSVSARAGRTPGKPTFKQWTESDLRAAVTTALDRAADAVEDAAPDPSALRSDAEELAEMSVAVASDVDEASRSERANVRARGVGGIHDENAQRWWGLERTTYLTRDLLDVLAQVDSLDGRHGDSVLLADAMRRVAELVSTPPGDSEVEQRIDAAWTAIDAYGGSLPAAEEAADPHDQPGLWLAATLGRITDISRRVYDALTP